MGRISWHENSYNFFRTHSNGYATFGTHGAHITKNEKGELEHHYTYHGRSIVILNVDRCTLTVNNFGYSSGRTPQHIGMVLGLYINNDYDVIQINNTNSDYWYNQCSKYLVEIFDIDSVKLKYKEKVYPIISNVVTIPKGEAPKRFRDNYFQVLVDKGDVRLRGKQVNSINMHQGICYRFCNKNYNGEGTMMFIPLRNNMSKRVYLKVR